MELAGAEARLMSSRVIGSEHILLGNIGEGDGITYQMPGQVASPEQIRQRVIGQTPGYQGG
jgi:ATP-dependent Clp protease ATP-binding subunit ClpC